MKLGTTRDGEPISLTEDGQLVLPPALEREAAELRSKMEAASADDVQALRDLLDYSTATSEGRGLSVQAPDAPMILRAIENPDPEVVEQIGIRMRMFGPLPLIAHALNIGIAFAKGQRAPANWREIRDKEVAEREERKREALANDLMEIMNNAGRKAKGEN